MTTSGRTCPVCGRWLYAEGYTQHCRMHERRGELVVTLRQTAWGDWRPEWRVKERQHG